MARTQTWVVPEFQVSSSAGGVNQFLGSLGIGIYAAQTTSWVSRTSSHNAARMSSRPLPTPGGVPSRRRREPAVESLSATADASSGVLADYGRFRPLFLGGGSRLVIPPAQPDPGADCVHRTTWSPRARSATTSRPIRGRGRVSAVAIGEAIGACTIPWCRIWKDHTSIVMGILRRVALDLVRTVQQNCQD